VQSRAQLDDDDDDDDHENGALSQIPGCPAFPNTNRACALLVYGRLARSAALPYGNSIPISFFSTVSLIHHRSQFITPRFS
jgi:hypothetical protein